jgi:hypothetical protein
MRFSYRQSEEDYSYFVSGDSVIQPSNVLTDRPAALCLCTYRTEAYQGTRGIERRRAYHSREPNNIRDIVSIWHANPVASNTDLGRVQV